MTGTLVAGSREEDFSLEISYDKEPGADTDELEAIIIAKTHRTIIDLRVAVRDGCVVLSGRTKRYYNKQLASEAILEQQMLVKNAIEVS